MKEEAKKKTGEGVVPPGPLGAPTSAISGKSGTMTGQTGGTEITEWSVTLTGEALEATSMASAGWREFILGLQGGTGSFTCIGSEPTVEEIASLVLETDDGVTPIVTITGKAIINSVEHGVSVEGVVTYSAEFTFSGAVVVT